MVKDGSERGYVLLSVMLCTIVDESISHHGWFMLRKSVSIEFTAAQLHMLQLAVECLQDLGC